MITLLLALSLSTAHADVPPPEAEACSGKQVGDPCPDPTSSGRCVDSTCTRVTPDGDGEYECVVCKFGAAATPSAADPLPPSKGCGCDQSAPAGAWLAGLAALQIVTRRERRKA